MIIVPIVVIKNLLKSEEMKQWYTQLLSSEEGQLHDRPVLAKGHIVPPESPFFHGTEWVSQDSSVAQAVKRYVT